MLAFWSFSCVVDVIFQVLRNFCFVAVPFLLLHCRMGLGNFFLFTKPAATESKLAVPLRGTFSDSGAVL